MASAVPSPPNDGLTAHDVVDDRIRYGEYATEGHYFYATDTDAIYRLDPGEATDPYDTLSLTPCNEHRPTGPSVETPGQPDYADNICALAGEIEVGRLHPLPDFVVTTVNDEAFLSLGAFVVRLPADQLTTTLREWLPADTDGDQFGDGKPIDSEQLVTNATTAIATVDDSVSDLTISSPKDRQPDCIGAAPSTSTNNSTDPATSKTTKHAISAAENTDITTRFIPCPQFSKWTFDLEPIRDWVETHLDGRTLNACAGENKLRHDAEVCRNDINPDREADTHLDVAELAVHYPEASFETIVFDPPWSVYQSNLRYEGEHVTKSAPETADGELIIDLESLPFKTPSPRRNSNSAMHGWRKKPSTTSSSPVAPTSS
jgi:hypothetical protein